jgi:NHL repeat
MSAPLRVSLAADRALPGVPATRAAPLLCPDGARVILGSIPDAGVPAVPVVPAADTLFGPRGVCLAGPGGPLFVADTGHHRVVIWRRCPGRDGEPADTVLGQADFVSEGRNRHGAPGAATLDVPTGIAFGAGVLAVADAWNHRVLLWHGLPRRAGQPADVVLGQADFAGHLANRGRAAPSVDTLNWCYGVTIADGRLIVADTGNRRVLVWDGLPEQNGAPADLVLGQADFASRDESAGAAPGAVGMRWPHAVLADEAALFVADAGANRVMVWRRFPRSDGAACDFALGQPDAAATDHNRGEWAPMAGSLNMPYGIARLGRRLVVADTANSRLLGFAFESLATGAPAIAVSGQRNFALRGDNRWREAARDSVNWPYGLACCDTFAAVADSGNDRVLLWETA